MNAQIIHIAKLPAARMMAVLALILSIPVELLSSAGYLADLGPEEWGIFALFPFIYALAAFMFTLLTTAVYNGFARRFGGIEFTAVQQPPVPDKSETA